jgi:hypothetical protein
MRIQIASALCVAAAPFAFAASAVAQQASDGTMRQVAASSRADDRRLSAGEGRIASSPPMPLAESARARTRGAAEAPDCPVADRDGSGRCVPRPR